MTNSELYLAELIQAGLKGIVPGDIPSGITIDEIIMIACKHHMPYLILSSLIKTKLTEEEKERIRPYIKRSTMKTLVQMKEYTDMHKAFEAAGVVNQPMKGVYMKKLYPSPVMREMSDVDVLITADSMSNAAKILMSLGYNMIEQERQHDVYKKGSYMIVEAHTALYDKTVDRGQYEYFKDFSKAKLNSGDKYTYNFGPEDFYVYMMAHMAKHFYAQGCGVRNLVDIYIYREHYKDSLNEEYLAEELEKCGILAFTSHMEKVAYIWLDNEESSQFYDNLLSYMIDSGIYGKIGNGIWSGFAKDKDESESHYHWKLKRFYWFPPYEYMEKYFPWIRGKKILLPLAWMIRGINGIVKKKGKQRRNLVSHMHEGDIKTYQEIYKAMQFNFHN